MTTAKLILCAVLLHYIVGQEVVPSPEPSSDVVNATDKIEQTTTLGNVSIPLLLSGNETTTNESKVAVKEEEVQRSNHAHLFNSSSIMLKAKVSILVTYVDTENKTQIASIIVPDEAKVTGEDFVKNETTDVKDYTRQFLEMTMFNDWKLTLVFTNATEHGALKEGEFALSSVDVVYDSATAPEGSFKNMTEPISGQATNSTHPASWTMRGPLHKSYKCEHGDSLVRVDKIVTVRFDNLQVQPFGEEGASFVAGTECTADKGSDIVPIVVGACLALLVVVVLVAYLVGRARTKRQGYASV